MSTTQQNIKLLREKIILLCEKGRYEGANGAIVLSEELYKTGDSISLDYSRRGSLSRTYYLASTSVRLNKKKKNGLSVHLRAWLYLRKAYRLSNDEVRQIGLRHSEIGDLLTRQLILRKRKRYRAALECVSEGLRRDTLTADTRILLLLGEAEICTKLGNFIHARNALSEAEKYLTEAAPTTVAQYHVGCANHFNVTHNQSEATQHRALAMKIAADNKFAYELTFLRTT